MYLIYMYWRTIDLQIKWIQYSLNNFNLFRANGTGTDSGMTGESSTTNGNGSSAYFTGSGESSRSKHNTNGLIDLKGTNRIKFVF